jgi:hypothetical protein
MLGVGKIDIEYEYDYEHDPRSHTASTPNRARNAA